MAKKLENLLPNVKGHFQKALPKGTTYLLDTKFPSERYGLPFGDIKEIISRLDLNQYLIFFGEFYIF
jgi:hypothetical protein